MRRIDASFPSPRLHYESLDSLERIDKKVTSIKYWEELGYIISRSNQRLNGVLRHSAFRLFYAGEHGNLALMWAHTYRCISEHAHEPGNLIIHGKRDENNPYFYFIVRLPK